MPRHTWATSDLQDAALSYADSARWPVRPGHFLDRDGCSCGRADCARPGSHPVARYWQAGPHGQAPTGGLPTDPLTTDRFTTDRFATDGSATGRSATAAANPAARSVPGRLGCDQAAMIRAWWGEDPYAIILPTGRQFDVLDLPGGPGRESLLRLELLGHELGPVAQAENGRILIWVRRGARASGPAGAWPGYHRLGVRCHGRGGYVLAPPCAGSRWLTPPGPGCPELPHAAPLLGVIACACRQAAARRSPGRLPVQRTGNRLEERLTGGLPRETPPRV